jgi:hypothetical protein
MTNDGLMEIISHLKDPNDKWNILVIRRDLKLAVEEICLARGLPTPRYYSEDPVDTEVREDYPVLRILEGK